MERENAKLREEMKGYITDFQKQLDLRDDEIRNLNYQLEHTQNNNRDQEIAALLRKEIETYKAENRTLRDKVGMLNSEIDQLIKQRSAKGAQKDLEGEVSHYRSLLNEKEQQIQKQKNEWAGIYGNMKQEIEDLKQDNRALQAESEKLIKQLESGGGQGGNRQLEKELAKKLKKRELECSALWETLKDMHISGRNVFDARQMLDILALRALDTKAKRKLKI